jgi:hypothetical protein
MYFKHVVLLLNLSYYLHGYHMYNRRDGGLTRARLPSPRLHTCSDYCIVHVCTQCRSVLSPVSQPPAASVIGRPAGPSTAKPVTVCRLHGSSKNVEQVAMPFVFKYLIAELVSAPPIQSPTAPSFLILTPPWRINSFSMDEL